VHPYDDHELIAGHGSVGLEILADFPEVDTVLVCCGGGGLVAGVATAIKLKAGHRVRVFAVEPVGAPTMALSLKAGRPQPYDPERHGTHAHGLAAPYAGPIAFEHVRRFVDGVLEVTDRELAEAARVLYQLGFVVETSGAAAVAAVLFDKVPGLEEGAKVAAVVTGSNIAIDELASEVFGVDAGDAVAS